MSRHNPRLALVALKHHSILGFLGRLPQCGGTGPNRSSKNDPPLRLHRRRPQPSKFNDQGCPCRYFNCVILYPMLL